MSSQVIEIQAGSLEEAEQKLDSQVPPGFAVLSRQTLSDGKPRTLQATAETTQAAWEKLLAQVPEESTIQSRREVKPPTRQAFTVQAFDEQEARQLASRQLGETGILMGMRVSIPPRKGLLGMGKSPGSYEVEILQPAVVEVTITSPARIRATVDHAVLVEAEQLTGLEDWKGIYHLRGEIQLEAFLLKIAAGPIEQFTLIPEATLGTLIESAHLGSSSKEDTSKGLAARLLELNCRNARVWKALFKASYGSPYGVQSVLYAQPVKALDLLLWYMYTPEAAADQMLRSETQLWFLGLAWDQYAECAPALQEQIAAALKDMILNWKGQYFYVIPRCCKVLAATGRKEFLAAVQEGIRRSDAEYSRTLREYARDDSVGYARDPAEELKEWEQFKQDVAKSMQN
jgi:hypothetical protein